MSGPVTNVPPITWNNGMPVVPPESAVLADLVAGQHALHDLHAALVPIDGLVDNGSAIGGVVFVSGSILTFGVFQTNLLPTELRATIAVLLPAEPKDFWAITLSAMD